MFKLLKPVGLLTHVKQTKRLLVVMPVVAFAILTKQEKVMMPIPDGISVLMLKQHVRENKSGLTELVQMIEMIAKTRLLNHHLPIGTLTVVNARRWLKKLAQIKARK